MTSNERSLPSRDMLEYPIPQIARIRFSHDSPPHKEESHFQTRRNPKRDSYFTLPALGTVERVNQQGMTVRTDDGRSVAFDMKDYAHVDRGYSLGSFADRTSPPGANRQRRVPSALAVMVMV
ncbi:MAG: hypothetical protein U9R64_02920 [Pseudomonadota bacterium]|nr:hypothetical protein [Pseudomonadota bacterium]